MPKKPSISTAEISKGFEQFAKKHKTKPVTEKAFSRVVKKAAGK